MSTVCPVILPILPVGVPVPIVDPPRTDFLWQRNPFLLEGKAQIVAPLWDAAPNLASNTLGKEGWELAAVLTHHGAMHFYFKRMND